MSAEIEPGLPGGNESRRSGEWIKFGLLVIVLIVVVLVVMAIRPLIFGRIVPAVMGAGQTSAPLVEDAAQPIKSSVEEETEAPNAEGEAATEETTAPEDAPATTEDQPENPADFPTSVPAVQHVVQSGQNLTAIAILYNVTVEAIVKANGITDPNHIKVGDTLIIPRP